MKPPTTLKLAVAKLPFQILNRSLSTVDQNRNTLQIPPISNKAYSHLGSPFQTLQAEDSRSLG